MIITSSHHHISANTLLESKHSAAYNIPIYRSITPAPMFSSLSLLRVHGRYATLPTTSFRQLSTGPTLQPLMATELDHICIVAKDINASIKWYCSIFGMKHVYTGANNFYPTCPKSPAFLQNGNAKIAIAPLEYIRDNSSGETGGDRAFTKRPHFGEHFALTLSREEFTRAERDLPLLLQMHSPASYVEEIEACDYGHQLSLFFNDLDGNVVEVTTWVDPASTDRLSQSRV